MDVELSLVLYIDQKNSTNSSQSFLGQRSRTVLCTVLDIGLFSAWLECWFVTDHPAAWSLTSWTHVSFERMLTAPAGLAHISYVAALLLVRFYWCGLGCSAPKESHKINQSHFFQYTSGKKAMQHVQHVSFKVQRFMGQEILAGRVAVEARGALTTSRTEYYWKINAYAILTLQAHSWHSEKSGTLKAVLDVPVLTISPVKLSWTFCSCLIVCSL